MDAKVHLQLANSIEAIAPVLDQIESVLDAKGADQQVVFRIRLALDELITNSITHGFPEGGEHSIAIDLTIGADRVAVELSDDGVPFNPLLAPDAVVTGSAEDRPIGGLGLHLVKELIPEVSYRHARGRNIVRLASPRSS
jgi:serine/threonine-protein kinase RsbW